MSVEAACRQAPAAGKAVLGIEDGMKHGGRDCQIGRICQLIEVAMERRSFTKYDIAQELGVHHRTAHRYLLAAEASGLVASELSGGDLTVWVGGWRLRRIGWQEPVA